MTPAFLLSLLPWLLPPLIGAAIGYITNAIAIKMLFRPLTEKRVFGIRIPFTPGIIPRQRYKLAESIGRMVSEQLITKEAVSTQLASTQFQAMLGKTISDATGRLLDTPLSSLKKNVIPVLGESLEEFIVRTLRNFFGSHGFLDMSRKLLTRLLGGLADKKLTVLVRELKLEPFLAERLHTLVAEDQARDRLIAKIQSWLAAQASGKKKLSAVIPEEAVHIAAQLFDSALPSLSTSLLEWLRQAHIRKELETRGKKLVARILEKLNLFQRLIVSVAQYDVTLQEKMPEIVDDVLNYVEELLTDHTQREQVVNVVKTAFLAWRQKEFSTLLGFKPAELGPKVESVIKKIWEYLRKQDADRRLFSKITGFLDKNSSLTLGRLANDYMGLSQEQVIEFALQHIEKREFGENLAGQIGSLLFEVINNRPNVKLGEFAGLDERRRREINAFLTDSVNSLLESRLPEMIQSLDIRSLVENKINGLDVADVEGLLLMVIARQLKWINVFGALLGGLIGLSQIIFKLLE
jgi:uncharacterized membrane protein YheB (UPF0754 family)